MQQSDKENDLAELKTELGTVVEVLSVLHEFIDSVFGAKYQNFLGGDDGTRGGGEQPAGGTSGKNVQLALRRLRWKHCKEGTEGSTDSGIARRESRADHGYASAGGTPVGGVMGEERQMTFGDLEKKMVGDLNSTDVGVVKSEGKTTQDDEESGCRFSVSVGRPEVVAVKCEVEDVDFLDDMDPFGSEPGDYHYEGDDNDLQIESCYSYTSPHLSSEPSTRQFQESSPIQTEPPHNSSSRFLPELIPIQQDPSVPALSTNIPTTSAQEPQDNDNDMDSGSLSSDNSDTEWKPTSSVNTGTSSRRPKNKETKRKLQPVSPFSRNTTPNHAYPRPQQQLPISGGCLFRCDLCPATYKQEESLRSHQKYKHNPSRVQCTCHLCGKSMVDKYRLQRHLRLHTGEKPFECEYCGQSFYRKDYHTKHLQRKHGISYNAGAVSAAKLVKKPKSSMSSTSSSSSTVTSISSGSSPSPFQGIMNNIFEPPGSPQRKTTTSSILPTHVSNRSNLVAASSSPSNTPGSLCADDFGKEQQHSRFMDIFSTQGHSTGHSEDTSMSNLMTMTNLTFDDLISADL